MNRALLACVAAALALAPTIAAAQSTTAGSLVIEKPWSRATPASAAVAGGYVVIRNTGEAPDRLLGGASDVAGRVEIHEMTMQNDVMRMRAMPQGLEIKPGQSVELKPGGYHVMFMDLKRPLKEGDKVAATLNFEKAGSVPLQFSVQALGAQAPTHGH